MQKSICGHCGHDKFESIVARPENSKVEVIFVQCSNYGAVAGVLELENIGALIREQNRAIHQIAEHLNIKIEPLHL